MLTQRSISPIIIGIPGETVDADTRLAIEKLNPIGFILFKRNCSSHEQLQALCAELQALSPISEPLIFIDQEGGRVVRIKWADYIAPAAYKFGELYEISKEKGLEAARLNGYVLAAQLMRDYGIRVNCLPVADVAVEGAHDVIGDRSFSKNPKTVSVLCAATMSGMLAGGNWPIIKHAPGHGRAMADSHKELPVVNESYESLMQTDFLPFKENAVAPFIMTAHISYPHLDGENCATQSKKILNILKKDLGMTGIIVSDDINMEALNGSVRQSAEKSLAAGCDLLLHSNGRLDELETLVGIQGASSDLLLRLHNLPHLPHVSEAFLVEAKNRLNELLVEVL